MRIYNNKNVETYKEFEKLARFSFASNLPNLFLCLYSALISSTVLVWVDVIVSIGENLHTFLVWRVAVKMRKETGDNYNFGLARLEVFVSFITTLIVILGMVGVVLGSAISLKNPEAPTAALIWFCLLKCCNTTYDVVLFFKQNKIYKEHPSKLNESERNAYFNAIINDAAVGILALICYLLRAHDFVKYFNPIISIVLACYFVFGYVRRLGGIIQEITDVSLPIAKQDEIFDIILENRQLIKKIVSVNCRSLNNIPHIEINLMFKEETTYSEMNHYLADIQQKINSIIENADVVLIISKPEE